MRPNFFYFHTMNIKLERPLAILDIEATGLSITQDRIVELAIVKIYPDGKREEFLEKINPEMEIPEDSIAIHGITNEEIADAPTLSKILPQLEKFLENCDIAGYNSNKFDLPMLAEELLRVESKLDLSEMNHIDVQNIFHKMEQRTLIAAYSFYCDKNLENAHSAMADANATWEVLDAQIGRYKDLQNDVAFLTDFSRHANVKRADFAGRLAFNGENEIIYNFGKHKGKTIEQVSQTEPGYFGWMLNADFPLYTKQVLKKEMKRIKEKNNPTKNLSFEEKLDQLKNKFQQ